MNKNDDFWNAIVPVESNDTTGANSNTADLEKELTNFKSINEKMKGELEALQKEIENLKSSIKDETAEENNEEPTEKENNNE